MTALGDLDRARIGELHTREVARFQEARPRSLAMIARSRAHMPNGMPMAWMAYHDDQPVYIDYGQGAGFTDDLLTRLVRIWLANRGIWEALPGAGPTACVPATRADVDYYVNTYAELLAELR
jgi:glutamate-1-semialdehyde 2,1-aminomutase